MDHQVIAQCIQDGTLRGKRKLIALAGPPASGKSTLADDLSALIPASAVVPMDGFHLDNAILKERGLQARKGSPDTFDVSGFGHLLKRLLAEDEVVYPIFDRATDRAIAGAARVGPEVTTVIVEGNYLLLDTPGWRDLMPLWDCSIYLSVSEAELRRRLMQRWLSHDFTEEQARAKVEGNDLRNAKLVASKLLQPQFTVEDERLEC